MTETMVSPSFTSRALQDDKVLLLEVYKDILDHCVLNFAEQIKASPHSGFAVLLLVSSTYELLGRMLRGQRGAGGKKEAEPNFIEGFTRVFDKCSPVAAKNVYSWLRCGLFHEGAIKPGIRLREQSEAVEEVSNSKEIGIDPKKLLEVTKSFFDNFFNKFIPDIKSSASSDPTTSAINEYCREVKRLNLARGNALSTNTLITLNANATQGTMKETLAPYSPKGIVSSGTTP